MGPATAEGPLPTVPFPSFQNGFPTSSATSYPHDTGIAPDEQVTDDHDGADNSHKVTADTPFRASEATNAFGSLPRRRHRKYTLQHGDSNFQQSANMPAVSEGDRNGQDGGISRHAASLKGKFRRASLTLIQGIVGRDRRNSEPTIDHHDQRPPTGHSTWNRLRQAATLRHLKPLHGDRPGLETIYSPLNANFPERPVPGHGVAPPFIPQHTGSAAKAAAAMQNDYLETTRQQHHAADDLSDWESGVGLAINVVEDNAETVTEEASAVARVDFIRWLPAELSVQILAHLDAAQLGTASRVSRFWNDITQDTHIWRQSFLRQKTLTYATGMSTPQGAGVGVPSSRPGLDWQKVYKARERLDQRWKIGTQACAAYLNGHTDSIYCLQFDEHKIITGSRDKTIRVWDLKTLQCRFVIGPPEVVNQTSILFDSTGKPVHYASFVDNPYFSPSIPNTVWFPMHHNASILCLQFDDEILVTGSSDSTCIVYSSQTSFRPIRRLQHHTAAVLDLAFDKKHIVTCSKDTTICVWDRQTGTMLKQLRGHTGPVNSVQLRGNTIISCSGDCSVRLWNIDTGKTVREFVGHTKGLACSQFSEDGRFVASAGNDKVIRIWDANTGECLREIPAHDSLVRSLHLDSISGRLISASYDTDIKVFDMETGEQLLNFPRWHASWILSAKSDYRRLISTGQDPKILIMDFGASIPDIALLESMGRHEEPCDAGFI